MIKMKMPPFFLELIILCKDDKNPPANVENWVEEGKIYKLKGLTKAINATDDNDISAIIVDNKGEVIKPTKDMFGFKANRFVMAFELCKN